jgi:crotonobetainyl-CoA:carnitine CoA-transferase CaiB-like acyl-CoA transferase
VLSPYKVLDLSNERGQLAGQILGDLGADVVLVEPPGGSSSRRYGPYVDQVPDLESSLFFWALNRNKRGITLNLDTDEGVDLLKRLAADVDFVFESFEPGYLDQRGIGYSALREVNPGLIMGSVSPFGQTGPKANWPASDLTVWASSFALMLTGDDDRPPVRLALPQAFLHASADAAAGAMIAHFARLQDGEGQHVDASAQASSMMATQSFVLSPAWGDLALTRTSGGVKLGPIVLKFIHEAADGYVSVTFLFGTAIGPFSQRLMDQMFEEGFVDEATRSKDWLNYTNLLLSGQEPLTELFRCIEAIGTWCKAHTKQELFEIALEKQLLLVPVSTTEDVVRSEQLAAREFWRDVEHHDPPRTVRYAGPFAKFSESPIEFRLPPPHIGEHNDEVYSALGLDDSERQRLFAEGVI